MLEAVQGAYQPVNIKQLSNVKGVSSKVKVAHSKQSTVKVGMKQPVALWLPKGTNLKQVNGEIILKSNLRTIGGHKLRAPIKNGQAVGSLKVAPIKGMPSVKIPVVAQQSVAKHSVFN